MTSQTSGPPARAARRPVGPDWKMMPGCSAIRMASSTSRFAAEDSDMPGFAATKEASRSATGGSNLTGVAARLLMTTFVVDMSHATGESSPPRLPAHSLCGDLAEGPYRVGLVHQENPGIGQVERAAHRSRVEFVNVASKQLHVAQL